MKVVRKKITFPIIAVIFVAAITVTLLVLFSPKQMTELEKISFQEKTQDVVYLLDALQEPEEPEADDSNKPEQDPDANLEDYHKYETIARHVGFALQLNFANTQEEKIKTHDLYEIIKSHLIIDYEEDELRSESLENHLVEHDAYYDREKDRFIYDNPYTDKHSIVHTPITVYLLSEVKYKKHNYYAKYQKYVIDNPYTALNRTSQDDIPHEHSINDYLNGHGTPISIKEVITKENIVDIAKPQGEINLVFELVDNSILLKEIK